MSSVETGNDAIVWEIIDKLESLGECCEQLSNFLLELERERDEKDILIRDLKAELNQVRLPPVSPSSSSWRGYLSSYWRVKQKE